MHRDFKQLSGDSRVYLFPSSRKFYPQETPEIVSRAADFCAAFDGIDIGFQYLYDRFLIFFVSDKTPLSIERNDELSAFVQTLEQEFQVQMLDKVNVCYKQGEFVQRKEIPEFKKMIKSRSVSPKTIVFDPMITTKQEYLTGWERPAGESWVAHLF